MMVAGRARNAKFIIREEVTEHAGRCNVKYLHVNGCA